MDQPDVTLYDVSGFERELADLAAILEMRAPSAHEQERIAHRLRALLERVLAKAPALSLDADEQETWEAQRSGGYVSLFGAETGVTAALSGEQVRSLRIESGDGAAAWQMDWSVGGLEGMLEAAGGSEATPVPELRVRITQDVTVIADHSFWGDGTVEDERDWDARLDRAIGGIEEVLRRASPPEGLGPPVAVAIPPVVDELVKGAARAVVGAAIAGVRQEIGETVVRQGTPPPPPETQWHYHHQGEQTGPIADGALRKLLAAGELPAGVMVWNPKLTGWSKANEVGLAVSGAPGAKQA